MTNTATAEHDDLCRTLVLDCIIENVHSDQGAEASLAIYDEECLAWGIRVGELIDQYLSDGTATCGCRNS